MSNSSVQREVQVQPPVRTSAWGAWSLPTTSQPLTASVTQQAIGNAIGKTISCSGEYTFWADIMSGMTHGDDHVATTPKSEIVELKNKLTGMCLQSETEVVSHGCSIYMTLHLHTDRPLLSFIFVRATEELRNFIQVDNHRALEVGRLREGWEPLKYEGRKDKKGTQRCL